MSEDLRIRLLIVDDEQSIRQLCMTVGEGLGFICMEADGGESALALLEEQPAHIILTDMVMPNMSGLTFLERVKKMLPRAEVAVMTGHGSVETAVQAMKLGAYDYISKPFSPLEELRLFLRRMAEKVRLVEENEFLRERVDTETELHGIVGASAKIQDVLRMISRLKDTHTPVLITGESGTGKELVARAIHFRGSFAKRPFVAVDCGSLVPTLIESELFGYERGAFTGAVKSRTGLFQSANGGTIFLDEIGELPQEMQAKLLRVLQEKEVRPVGSNQKVKGGRARHRGHQPRSRSGISQWHVSQGSLLPSERGDRAPALAARTPLRHPDAGALVSGALCARQFDPDHHRGHEVVAAIRLAGKCSRAGKLH